MPRPTLVCRLCGRPLPHPLALREQLGLADCSQIWNLNSEIKKLKSEIWNRVVSRLVALLMSCCLLDSICILICHEIYYLLLLAVAFEIHIVVCFAFVSFRCLTLRREHKILLSEWERTREREREVVQSGRNVIDALLPTQIKEQLINDNSPTSIQPHLLPSTPPPSELSPVHWHHHQQLSVGADLLASST